MKLILRNLISCIAFALLFNSFGFTKSVINRVQGGELGTLDPQTVVTYAKALNTSKTEPNMNSLGVKALYKI